MPRPTPIGLRHEILALAREGMPQGTLLDGWVSVAKLSIASSIDMPRLVLLNQGSLQGLHEKLRLAKTGHCSEWCEKIALDLHDLSMRG